MLFRILVGQERPDSGTVRIMGKNIYAISELEFNELRKNMGIIFEQPALWNDLTAAGNVARLMEEHRPELPPEEVKRRVAYKLKLVDMLPHRDKKPYKLSGDEKRRVSIARGMALDPPLLICDELTAGLDPPLARHVCDILKGLNRDFKVTCVVATHNVDTAFLIADKIVLLKRADKEAGEDWEGTKIIAQGTVEEVKKTDNKYIQEFLSRRAET